jgi:Rrf2 family protein
LIKINKSTKYALYAIVELSRDPEKVLSTKKIASEYGISEHHLSKVMQQLQRAGFIRSIRGPKGGFQIARDPKDTTIIDVVEVFEIRPPQNACVLFDFELKYMQGDLCRLGEIFTELHEHVYSTLKSVSFSTLITRKK